MNKDAMIVLIIFLIVFTISKGGSFFLMRQMSSQTEQFLETVLAQQDSLETTTVEDSVRAEPKRDYLQNSDIEDLKKELNDRFDFVEFRKLKRSEIDSLRQVFNEKLELILSDKKKLLAEYNKKIENNKSIKDSLLVAKETIKNLKKSNEELKKKKETEKENEEEKKKIASYIQLAQTYDTMDAEVVANILLNLDNETIAEILSRMNDRKVGKILEAMPTRRATTLAKYITED